MKLSIYSLLLALVVVLTLFGCKVEKKGGNGFVPNADYIDLGSIPTQFNPQKEGYDLDLQGAEKIQMDLFGFNRDVRLQYSDQMPLGMAHLQIFSVSKESVSLHGISLSEDKEAKTFNINKSGSYFCSIRIHNRQITDLKGACYTRVILILPSRAKVEVYNLGTLISRRFIPMDNQSFLKELDRAYTNDKKMAVIETYLNSYRVTATTPVLSCHELGMALSEFNFSEQKLTVLRVLQRYISDRENIEKMIEDNFSYFDREKARKIVGLKP